MSSSGRRDDLCPPFTSRNPPWRLEAVELLKRLVAGGLHSCSQIGVELGMTRNAVIGKMNRLGISTLQPKSPAQPRPRKIREIRFRPKPPPPAIEIEDEVDMRDATEFIGVPLVELDADGCRFAKGDGYVEPYRFCNLPRKPGESYCAAHCRLCYVPASDRRQNFRAYIPRNEKQQ